MEIDIGLKGVSGSGYHVSGKQTVEKQSFGKKSEALALSEGLTNGLQQKFRKKFELLTPLSSLLSPI